MDKIEVVKEETQALVGKIISDFELEVSEDAGAYHVTIKADADAPVVIGRHGETIKALQKLLEVIMYKRLGEGVDVLLNVNDYRERQKDRLLEIAERSIADVKSGGQPASIGRLSSYERKVIHEYVTSTYPDLQSYSEGEGRDRRLVIATKGEKE